MNATQRRAAKAAEFRAWLDRVLGAALAEGRGLTAAEETEKTRFEAELQALDSLVALEARSASLGAAPAAPAAPAAAAPTPTAPAAAVVVPDAGPVAGRVEVLGAGVERDPWRGFGASATPDADFARAVMNACKPGGFVDSRLTAGGLMPGGIMAAPTNYHQSGGPEGAMIPPAMRDAIWEVVNDDPLMNLLTIEPTNSPVVDLMADESTPWGSSGIQAYWRVEAGQMSASKLDTKPRQVRAHELYAFVLAPEELLEDAPRLQDRITRKAPQALRWKIVESFMFGTGAGQPLGWAHANNAAKVGYTRKTASHIEPDDLVGMFARLLQQDGPDRSFWACNRDTLPDLVLRSVVGNVPLWMPPSGLAGAPNGTILGRPVFFTEHSQTLGTAGDLQFVNPNGYYAIMRGTTKFDSSIHLFFDYAIMAFRWMVRFGGQPFASAAVSPAKGSATKAHFIILT